MAQKKVTKKPAAPAKKEVVKEPKKVVSNKNALVLRKFTLLKLIDWMTNVVKNPNTQEESRTPLALHGSASRSRNKIRAIVIERAKQIEDDRIELVSKHTEKDKEGKDAINEETGEYKVVDRAKFDEEFLAMMAEDTVFDILPSNRQDWIEVKNLILNNLKSEMTVDDTTVYEEICVAFEAI